MLFLRFEFLDIPCSFLVCAIREHVTLKDKTFEILCFG